MLERLNARRQSFEFSLAHSFVFVRAENTHGLPAAKRLLRERWELAWADDRVSR